MPFLQKSEILVQVKLLRHAVLCIQKSLHRKPPAGRGTGHYTLRGPINKDDAD